MYRILFGDLQKLRALLLTHGTVKLNAQIDHTLLGLTSCAIVGMDPRTLKPSNGCY
jgi:hypothetical protein